MKRLSEEIKTAIVNDFSNGATVNQIRDKYNVTRASITAILIKAGLYKRLADREPITFNCRHCGAKVVTTPETGDHRTVFCCPHCERQYWRDKTR